LNSGPGSGLVFFFFFFFGFLGFLVILEFELRVLSLLAGALPLKPLLQSFAWFFKTGSYQVAQAGLELTVLASTSLVLRLQVCSTMPSFMVFQAYKNKPSIQRHP
jgi:hypothetical protein